MKRNKEQLIENSFSNNKKLSGDDIFDFLNKSLKRLVPGTTFVAIAFGLITFSAKPGVGEFGISITVGIAGTLLLLKALEVFGREITGILKSSTVIDRFVITLYSMGYVATAVGLSVGAIIKMKQLFN